MSRDYKPTSQKNTSRGSPFLTGLLIGLLLGVGLSVGLTMYLKGSESPFSEEKMNKPISEKILEEKIAEDSEASKEENTDEVKPENNFDFYTILPETESTVTEKEVQESALTVKKENYFLQVGAFQNEADADNMKAKLALLGFEAVVKTATIPEKGIWHRVRVGPLNDLEKINKIRGELTTNGFNTDLIKVHTETKSE
jgi:cell division protein FtsN